MRIESLLASCCLVYFFEWKTTDWILNRFEWSGINEEPVAGNARRNSIFFIVIITDNQQTMTGPRTINLLNTERTTDTARAAEQFPPLTKLNFNFAFSASISRPITYFCVCVCVFNFHIVTLDHFPNLWLFESRQKKLFGAGRGDVF
jgi:hypothetical protein